MSVLLVAKSTSRATAAWVGRPYFNFRVGSSFLAMSTNSNQKKRKTLHTWIGGTKLLPVQECIQVQGESGVQFLDGSWFLGTDRNGRQEYERGPRIPGAHFFDIDQVASTGELRNPKGLPHMLPPASVFAAAMDAMGIVKDDHLIVYASKGCMMVHRALFQLQAHGHDRERIHLMDGSLEDWETAGGPLDQEPTKAITIDAMKEQSQQYTYTATDATQVVDMEEVKRIIKDKTGEVLVDVRSAERFYGEVEEPRPGMRLGHMPGAKNLFFYTLLREDNVGRLKPKAELKKLIQDAGIDIDTDQRIVISCGSGATACALAAALDVCGRDPSTTFIYDGSWSEWGGEKDTPITKEKDE